MYCIQKVTTDPFEISANSTKVGIPALPYTQTILSISSKLSRRREILPDSSGNMKEVKKNYC